jgi:hypothetical protein
VNARVLAVSAIVLAACVLGSGCGGDSDSTTTASGPSKPLTKAEFVRQGDAICKKGISEKNRAIEESLDKLSAKQRADQATLERLLVEVALPPVQEMAEELDDLGAPKGEKKKVAIVVDALKTALEDAEADPATALNESEEIFGRSDRLAGRYGLKACAQV